LILVAPEIFAHDTTLFAALSDIAVRTDEQGVHFHYTLGNGDTLQILRLTSIAADKPLVALIPLDQDGLDRIQATERLLRALMGRPVPRDTRLTPQQRRRARHMLQAVDGRTNGASYREIAEAIFGAPRVAADPWKTSPLRDTTMALVRDALAMIAGGYRTLLRRRHRS
jgi:hypothetical protein